MKILKTPLIILNLSGELKPELAEYFQLREFKVVGPEDNIVGKEWSHVLTRDLQNFDILNETYDLTRKNRFIISLSKIEDLQNFAINNGNFVIDESWLDSSMGIFILDKYFHSYGGVSLENNYPAFMELGTFNVTNPFNTGEYLDRMVHSAFENDIDALLLKTFFDHLVMYLTALKKKGVVGLPFEVTYGAFESNYAVQINFYAENIDLFDLTANLTPSSFRIEDHLLHITLQSTDFFDLSYLPEVNKVVITGLWSKGLKNTLGNRGMLISSVDAGGSTFVQYEPSETLTTILTSAEIPDITNKVSFSNPLEEEVPTIVKDNLEIDISDEEILIKQDSKLEEYVQTISGKFEDDKTVIRVSGNKLDIDKFAYRIAANVDETTKEKNLKVRSLEDKLPEAIKAGLYDFAHQINRPTEELNDEELVEFQLTRMPEIIRKGLLPAEINFVSGTNGSNKAEKKTVTDTNNETELKLMATQKENEELKAQLKNLNTEVRVLKESKRVLNEVQTKATVTDNRVIQNNPDPVDKVRQQIKEKIDTKRVLDQEELQKVSTILADVKKKELSARKIEIESEQKETYFAQEIEKNVRQIKAKDLMMIKAKETFTKLLDKKENEISDLRMKVDQLTKLLATAPSSTQNTILKDMEKQNHNLLKQVEVYKIKLSNLSTNLTSSTPDKNYKEDARKLQMQNQQLQNLLNSTKKEVDKLQYKASVESERVATLTQEKSSLEQQLKKLQNESSKEAPSSQPNTFDPEIKKILSQNQMLENQLKDASAKIAHLESRLAESMRAQKNSVGMDEGTKVKVNQLSTTVKKLTQDLVDSRNFLAETKKETNKLRQEKTALQNQLDKLKKDSDKAKAAVPKKNNGKAA